VGAPTWIAASSALAVTANSISSSTGRNPQMSSISLIVM
jgi:hypothetical protein